MVNGVEDVTRSSGVAKLPLIDRFLGKPIRLLRPGLWTRNRLKAFAAVVGWGFRPTAAKARALAADHGLPYVAVEDGFLRSYGTGNRFPPLSMVVDTVGMYYDCRAPSLLENLLNEPRNLLEGIEEEIDQAIAEIIQHCVSKYNHAPLWKPSGVAKSWLDRQDVKRILVVDQTVGDMSVEGAGSSASTFKEMLAAARQENPGAVIFIKTHPEVTSGQKRGYLTDVHEDDRTVVLREAINPASLIRHMDRVYVVSSTMGFEALLLGKSVTCFGMPWYAGWGVTDDRQVCARRKQRHTVKSLFVGAYWHYSRYIDPVTHQLGRLSDVTGWLILQQQMNHRLFGDHTEARMFVVGLARWKRYNLRPMLSLQPERMRFVKDARHLASLELTSQDTVLWWGAEPHHGVMELVHKIGCQTLRVEDGFIRSVGLGSDMVRPMSLVMDKTGIYFDATRPSDLENILNTADFDDEELSRAAGIRSFIVKHGVTKYNVEIRCHLDWQTQGRRVLLVPGQVEDDASIRLGCTELRTNLGLLDAVRQGNPDAFIVYKPHPDVLSGNRRGKVHIQRALQFADVIHTDWSVIDCIEACDEVHTLTSLTGFDALLRGKTVVTYGQPFYAGWGLTQDRCMDGVAFSRRRRKLTLDELVAGVLLRYPVYWDWTLTGYTSCEAVLNRLVEEREMMKQAGKLGKLGRGQLRRWGRQLSVHVKSWFV